MVALSFTGQGLQTSILTGGMFPLIVIGFLSKKALKINNN
jgi:hypothetical protein